VRENRDEEAKKEAEQSLNRSTDRHQERERGILMGRLSFPSLKTTTRYQKLCSI
jgi:hypothetical protein